MMRFCGAGAFALMLVSLAGCKGKGDESASAASEPVITLGKENIAVAASTELRSGPGISGTLEPVQTASVRAEVAGPVVATYAEAGDRVKRGAVLARIDDVALRDAFLSARSGVRSTEASLELARRNLERSERLSQAGAVADRDLESTRVQATNAEGALADARSRLASAQKQLDNATIRAPFDGIVSERVCPHGRRRPGGRRAVFGASNRRSSGSRGASRPIRSVGSQRGHARWSSR